MIIWENEIFFIEPHQSNIPWVKIFTKEPHKELTDIPKEVRNQMWNIYYTVEEEMIKYFEPTKVNMASFANMLPRVHIHVMARFKEDEYFPNPVWGEKQREAKLNLPDFEIFYKRLNKQLTKQFD